MEFFPVEIMSASYEQILRVPGIGVTNALKIMKARRVAKLNFADLKNMRVVLKRARHFITVGGKFDGLYSSDTAHLKNLLTLPSGKELNEAQMSIFSIGGQIAAI